MAGWVSFVNEGAKFIFGLLGGRWIWAVGGRAVFGYKAPYKSF